MNHQHFVSLLTACVDGIHCIVGLLAGSSVHVMVSMHVGAQLCSDLNTLPMKVEDSGLS